MKATVKALLAKVWKDEEADLTPGTHNFDEEFIVRVSGNIEKQEDQLVTPTVSIPLISVLALFWEKAGIAQGQAMSLLREAMIEAMDAGVGEDSHIKSRIDDVNAAIKVRPGRSAGRTPKDAPCRSHNHQGTANQHHIPCPSRSGGMNSEWHGGRFFRVIETPA